MTKPPVIHSLSRTELRDLQHAKSLLENPGFTVRLANLLGAPIEKGFALLPKGWDGQSELRHKRRADESVAIVRRQFGQTQTPRVARFFHKVVVGTSGTIGGAFGLAAFPVELPVSTAIMLRSIADIARSEGHDISQLQTRLECLEVFALDGTGVPGAIAESSYWLTRAALSKSLSEAVSFLSEKGAVDVAAPAMIRLINAIASRFGIMVSEEVAAKALPVIGAAGGGLINVLFIAHFQDMARGHFIVKRLEAVHGTGVVRNAYADVVIQK